MKVSIRPIQTHKRRQIFFRCLAGLFVAIALYDLYLKDVIAAMAMMYISLYFQMLTMNSETEEKIDALIIAHTDTNSN